MPRLISENFRRFDWVLFGSSVLLVVFGLAALYSTSLGTETAGFGAGNFRKQVVFAVAGILVAFAASTFNYHALSGLAKPLYAGSVLLLISVLIFGSTIRGTTGWFGIAGFGIQPVEIVKLLLIVFLARFFSDHARDPEKVRHTVGSTLALGVVFGLVVLQPDVGSALLLAAVWGILLLVSGIRRSHLLLMAVIAMVAGALAWGLILKPYQKDRITSFMDPGSDPRGKGYNVTQSMIAIGSGGLTGKGLGYGSQSQLRFLPERQTDFIFAVIAEELGFLGVMFLLAVFAAFFWRGYRIAAGARDDFTLFLVLGIMVSVAVEVLVNIGGNLRLLPVTGVTLPFISYGGSSLLVKFLMVGILESVAVRR